MIRKHLSKYYYDNIHGGALDMRVRHLLGTLSVAELKPFSRRAAISDLFVWRCDDTWETDFELFNITSFVYPQENPKERCNFIFFDSDGREIAREEIILDPFERRTLQVSAYLGGAKGFGTFSVFHHSDLAGRFEEKGSHLTERGYIGYRRRGEALKSFCHGNLQSLAQAPGARGYAYVAATTGSMRYYPQLIVSDCSRFELIYTNPSARPRALTVGLFNASGHKTGERHAIIPARGVRVLDIDNEDRAIHTFDNRGGIVMWRPVIVKYYETHFDAMHG